MSTATLAYNYAQALTALERAQAYHRENSDLSNEAVDVTWSSSTTGYSDLSSAVAVVVRERINGIVQQALGDMERHVERLRRELIDALAAETARDP